MNEMVAENQSRTMMDDIQVECRRQKKSIFVISYHHQYNVADKWAIFHNLNGFGCLVHALTLPSHPFQIMNAHTL